MESMQIDVGGRLLLDKTEVEVQQCVNVYWDFSNSAYIPNSRDFIGVLEVGMTLVCHASRYEFVGLWL